MNGRRTSLGYCWACGPRPRMTAPSPLPSWYTASPWSFPASSWTPPSRRPLAADFLEHMRPGPVSIPTRPICRPPQETNQLLQQAKWVYIKRGGTLPRLTLPYAGPYAVAEAGEKTFEVLVGGQQQRISVDRLKLHTGPAPVSAAPPARRGRPPWSAAEGADRSGGRNDPHLRGSCSSPA
jgi:hypothetical protein